MCKVIISALLITIFYSASGAITSNTFKPCKLPNRDCLDNLINILRPLIIGGIPEMEVESSDPMSVEEIVGDVSGFKYKLSNSTWIGYSNCVQTNMTVNEAITKIEYDVNCPSLILSGKYEMSGQIITLPVEGHGDYKIITGKYQLHIASDFMTTKDASGKSHLSLKSLKIKAVALTPTHFDFKNMFNGNQEKSDEFHKFMHENWKEISDSFDSPIFYTCIGKVANNTNRFFQNVPLEDFILL
ncbi:unnamed protein product [Euphydryas editha]|uniref:Uncharacterized protein n=1 Tax=Euphydryas editha TaxID=104508 RepID=A0AAU9TIY4_EUPED|nr:unnamed protein product [Euphydryas editha]